MQMHAPADATPHEFWMPFPGTDEWDQCSRADRAMTYAALGQILLDDLRYGILKQDKRIKITVPASYAVKVMEADRLGLPEMPAP